MFEWGGHPSIRGSAGFAGLLVCRFSGFQVFRFQFSVVQVCRFSRFAGFSGLQVFQVFRFAGLQGGHL